MRRRYGVVAVVFLMVLGVGRPSFSYWYFGPTWPSNPVMHLQLGSISGGGTLQDGSTTWGQPAEAALAIWNEYVDTIEFRVVRDSTAPVVLGNGISNVYWSTMAFGRSFDGHSGYATNWIIGGRYTEGDVVFNSAFSWNSYRGNQRPPTFDLRRLALHEFGHTLGLDHPDEHGQDVSSQMLSYSTPLDTLSADDISGAQYLYSIGGSGAVSFPARNESMDFRSRLETKYRDGLRRGNTTTYVDTEGDIVWLSEYFRYRVNDCSHTQAQTRVFAQIDNTGTYGVCGRVSASNVAFPPRNESLTFRNALEAKYRDQLRRGAGQSAVDNEGDVVWVQEYLRYRVNGCSHQVAIDKVFAQIDGLGVQALCR
jgi:hypothetical protein